MMIDKRLIGTVKEAPRYIAGNVACQWVGLLANVAAVFSVAILLNAALDGTWTAGGLALTALTVAAAVLVRFLCAGAAARMSYKASSRVKKVLRDRLCEKLLRLGPSYTGRVSTSEVVQVSTEGVDQLETYFGRYLPQLFYSLLAPVTLFAVLAPVHLPAAVALLCCVPLIPISIIAIQKVAKKLLGRYWSAYAGLGDCFLENLQGLTTLKIYGADGAKHQEMNRQAEAFRKITMKVLTMQLSSVTVMDLVAFGGAALGVILSVTGLRSGTLHLAGAVAVILLSAEFFIPLRLLGSYFHIAMNGMAASEKIFRILDLDEPPAGREESVPGETPIRFEDVSFSYDGERTVLSGVSFTVPPRGFVSIAGVSGSGKSTIAGLLLGENRGYAGSIRLGDLELSEIRTAALMRRITRVSHDSYLFGGTVAENLRMGKPDATEAEMNGALREVNLLGFLQTRRGLDTVLTEQGGNLSGGQRQRLALARALLRESDVYVFDEATSNIDAESEADCMAAIHALARTKTVLLISHRLANLVHSDLICMVEGGRIAEQGTHKALIKKNGPYARLYREQQALEHYAEGGETLCEEAV